MNLYFYRASFSDAVLEHSKKILERYYVDNDPRYCDESIGYELYLDRNDYRDDIYYEYINLSSYLQERISYDSYIYEPHKLGGITLLAMFRDRSLH